MSKVVWKKTQITEFDKKTEKSVDIEKDINILIRELKESDEREKREREERIDKIFREVILDGK